MAEASRGDADDQYSSEDDVGSDSTFRLTGDHSADLDRFFARFASAKLQLADTVSPVATRAADRPAATRTVVPAAPTMRQVLQRFIGREQEMWDTLFRKQNLVRVADQQGGVAVRTAWQDAAHAGDAEDYEYSYSEEDTDGGGQGSAVRTATGQHEEDEDEYSYTEDDELEDSAHRGSVRTFDLTGDHREDILRFFARYDPGKLGIIDAVSSRFVRLC